MLRPIYLIADKQRRSSDCFYLKKLVKGQSLSEFRYLGWGCTPALSQWLPASVVVSRLVQWDLLIQLCVWCHAAGYSSLEHVTSNRAHPQGQSYCHTPPYSPCCAVKMTLIYRLTWIKTQVLCLHQEIWTSTTKQRTGFRLPQSSGLIRSKLRLRPYSNEGKLGSIFEGMLSQFAHVLFPAFL